MYRGVLLINCRITALGTGDIGGSFAKRAKAFEPKTLIVVSKSGKSSESSFDKEIKIDDLDLMHVVDRKKGY